MTDLAQTAHHRHISTLAALLCLSLAACGGGGSSSTSTETSTDGTGTTTTTTTTDGSTTTTTTDASGNVIPTPSATPTNVALAANGGIASTTYDNAHASVINDGDTSTTNYWVGNAQNDALTIAFDKTYHVSGFTLYTNATNNVDTRIELSTDGVNYSAINLLGAVISGGSGIPCSGLNMGSGKIACTLSSMPQASQIRVVVTASTAADIADTRIDEMEVTGQ